MENQNIQHQIDALNTKLDLILEYIHHQKQKNERIDDLVSDLSIVGKDIYDTAVTELENQGVEIDLEDIRIVGVKLVKNMKNFSTLLNTLESFMDFMKDAAPIANEVMIDFSHKLHKFEEKGYFEFFKESTRIFDNIVSNFSKEDVQQLADNIVSILNTIKNLTQPQMLQLANSAVNVYGSLNMSEVPRYSIWKLMRELGNPEMQKALGFMVTFIKNMASNAENNNHLKK